ncbi:hypothetical protein ACN42_g4640 [Penicillium freii]|uniref:Uncharacterized protein n=1 Tax=Penicillium freii TaxID=48697 RepID=A0A124GRV6_PENFR|nr:hypothetical protein ACN42_g4640 [Penicillium freii]
MNYDFPEVMMVGRWRSARVYTRDDDTTPIITCTTFDSLAEHMTCTSLAPHQLKFCGYDPDVGYSEYIQRDEELEIKRGHL